VLNDIVEYFVIVESTHTFVGKEKALSFNENKHLFEKFSNKIIHIIVDDLPHKYHHTDICKDDVWKNEYFQRNAISRGINCINDLSDSDVLIISDLDEIPDPRTLNRIKMGEIVIDINTLLMEMYYYNLHTKYPELWTGCKIVSYKKYKELNTTCEHIRNIPSSIIVNGGWHLSYFGDKYFIQNKIFNFSHQELNNSNNTELEKIEARMKDNKDLFNRNIAFHIIKIEDNRYLPTDYHKYLNKYYN
jgi:beta-1,4-mannosyl-glycoprotein beta-1,4-N-acetylglucosaminyltransferase